MSKKQKKSANSCRFTNVAHLIQNYIYIYYQVILSIYSLMRQARHQRISSLHVNKQNEYASNHPNANMNLPVLRNHNKVSLKNQYHLNLNQRKKTYLNLYTKKQNIGAKQAEKNIYYSKRSIQTTRLSNDKTLSTQLSGLYLSSRPDKVNIKSHRQNLKTEKHTILQRHQITGRMRAKMIDWLLEICEAYKCKNQTFFLAVHLMDKYFAQCERSLAISQLHIIGVTCIFMACKYEQIHPLRMKTVVRDIGHNKIPAKDVSNRQSDILSALQFKFERKCQYLISQQILQQFNKIIPEYQLQMLKQNTCYFLKLISFDCNLFRNQNSQILAKGAILAAVRSMSQLKNLQIYDSFISSCGKDYESCHHICSQILFLNVNFKSEYGSLENIHKNCPIKSSKNCLIQSCAL